MQKPYTGATFSFGIARCGFVVPLGTRFLTETFGSQLSLLPVPWPTGMQRDPGPHHPHVAAIE